VGKGLPPAKYYCYTIIEISYIIHIYDKKWMKKIRWIAEKRNHPISAGVAISKEKDQRVMDLFGALIFMGKMRP
jgi:hypothetical protein